MEITFVNSYSGDAPKRRRLAQACERCRQRKKRCIHIIDIDESETTSEKPPVTPAASPRTASTRRPSDKRNSLRTPSLRADRITQNGAPHNIDSEEPTQTVTDSGRARFISDLIPEATLLNRPPPSAVRSREQPNDDIGVWVDRREWDALVAQRNDAGITTESAAQHSQRPHPSVVAPLINVYFEKIHPILPLLDEDDFRRECAAGTESEALVQAICLVAAKDESCAPLLKLADASDTTVPTRQFTGVLHRSVTATLKATPRIDKITLIRILALTSLHTQGTEGAEEASILLSQAMHHAQTLGIHLGIPANTPVGKEREMKRLFWSLWILDRCNATTNGRPVIMGDIDIAIDDFAPGTSGFPAFEAWLKIAQLLNKILHFYRPTSDTSSTGWEGSLVGLEEIIDEVRGWHLPASLLATLHLFYLTVGILSHRSRGLREIPRALSSSVRQRLCAIEVARLLTAPPAGGLHPMPIIPYAVSLALSVSYQHLRQSQLEHQQADAREDFRTCCRLLHALRRTWCSADVMATLAQKVLDQLDRAPTLASYRIPRRYMQTSEVAPPVEEDVIPPPTACAGDVDGSFGRGGQNGDRAAGHDSGLAVAETEEQQPVVNDVGLFDNVDDVFGGFLDPNYPLNLDDMAFFGNFNAVDWTGEMA